MKKIIWFAVLCGILCATLFFNTPLAQATKPTVTITTSPTNPPYFFDRPNKVSVKISSSVKGSTIKYSWQGPSSYKTYGGATSPENTGDATLYYKVIDPATGDYTENTYPITTFYHLVPRISTTPDRPDQGRQYSKLVIAITANHTNVTISYRLTKSGETPGGLTTYSVPFTVPAGTYTLYYEVKSNDTKETKTGHATYTVQTTSSGTPGGGGTGFCTSDEISTLLGCFKDLNGFLVELFNWSFNLAGAIALAMLVFAGFTYISSAGNPDSIERAKGMIANIVMALFLLVLGNAFFAIITGYSISEVGITGATTRAFKGIMEGVEGAGGVTSLWGFVQLFRNIVEKILNPIGGIFAFIFIILGGLRYMTAAGSEEAVEQAKAMLKAAIVGIVIILLANTIIQIVATIAA